MGVMMVVGQNVSNLVESLKKAGHIVWDAQSAEQFRDFMASRGGAFDLCIIDPCVEFESQSIVDLFQESLEFGDFVPPIQLINENLEVRSALIGLGFQVRSEIFEIEGKNLNLL